MKSGKQRRTELRARRRAAVQVGREVSPGLPVDVHALAPSNSYGAPAFVTRGTYLDRVVRCRACGVDEVWTAAQQKWWFEVAKGPLYSTAAHCRSCRQRARAQIVAQQALEAGLGGLDPSDPAALARVAELYVAMDRLDKALLYLRRARNRAASAEDVAGLEARIAALLARGGRI